MEESKECDDLKSDNGKSYKYKGASFNTIHAIQYIQCSEKAFSYSSVLHNAYSSIHDFIMIKTYVFRSVDSLDLNAIQLSLSICIPKPCSIKESISSFVNKVPLVKYKEEFCRFKGDKPWTPGLYVAL